MEIKPINYLFKAKYPGWYIKKGIFRWSNEVHLLEAKVEGKKEIVAICQSEKVLDNPNDEKSKTRWAWTAETSTGKWIIDKIKIGLLEYQISFIDWETRQMNAQLKLKTYHKGVLYGFDKQEYTWKSTTSWGVNYGWFDNKKLVLKSHKDAFGFFRVKPDNQLIDEINLSLMVLASYFLLLHISPPRRGFDSLGFLSLFSFLEE